LLLSQLLSFLTLNQGNLVAVEDFDLRHGMNNLKPVVRFLSQRVAEKIKLLKEGELGEELQEVVQVPQLVVANQQHVQEFELFDAFNVVQVIDLCVDLLHAKVLRDVVESL
jgi:hypothetical protein